MTEIEKQSAYVLFTCLNPDGKITAITAPDMRFYAIIVEPGARRITEGGWGLVGGYDRGEEAVAISDFFNAMKTSGLPGVVDLAEVRLFQDTPLGFCDAMTTHIWEDIEADLEEHAGEPRDDDFDTHELAALREAMVDACPEYNGTPPLEI